MKLGTSFFVLACTISISVVSPNAFATSCGGSGYIGTEHVSTNANGNSWQLSQLSCIGGTITDTHQDVVFSTASQILANSLSNAVIFGHRVFVNSCNTRFINLDEDYESDLGGVSKSDAAFPPSSSTAYNDDFPEPVYHPLLQPCYVPPPAPVENPTLGKTCSPHDPTPIAGGSNAVNVITGNEVHSETDFDQLGLLSFRRTYNSQAIYEGDLGPRWQHNYERQLLIDGSTALIIRSNGRVLEFTESGGNWAGSTEPVAKFENITGGKYRYTTAQGVVEEYDSLGRWETTKWPNGGQLTAEYDSGTGKLSVVKDQFDNTLMFAFDTATGLLESVTLPDNETKYEYTYTPTEGMLEKVTSPPDTDELPIQNMVRTYIYDDPNWPRALTGIEDENNERYATWKYYAADEKVEYEYMGELDDNNDITDEPEYMHFAYDPGAGKTTVTNARGKVTEYNYSLHAGVERLDTVDGLASTNCDPGTQSYTYDTTTGQIETKTDWEGNVTRYSYNGRGLEYSRVEAEGDTSVPSAERTIGTIWHTTYNLPTIITEAGRTTTYGYTLSGVLETKTVANTVAEYTVPPRVWTYTYTQGQIDTIDGPRIDVDGSDDLENYDYEPNGFLDKYTNAAGHVTDVTSHNEWGLPTVIKDANGIDTTLKYNDRGWLKSTSTDVGDVTYTTQYGYDAVGQLTTLTLPNNVAYTFEYDSAHRLIAIQNSKSERIEYEYELKPLGLGVGGRRVELIKSAGGATEFDVEQRLDELGRVIALLDHNEVAHTYDHDANGNVDYEKDRKGYELSRMFDGLNRLRTVIFPDTGIAEYTYNALDQLTAVKDQENHSTTYKYDGLGNLREMTSPDTGTTTFNDYDRAGNLKQKTDSRGKVTKYEYDMLNRLTSIEHPATPSLDVTFTYDQTDFSYGIGRLGMIVDRTGYTNFFYDQLGRVYFRNVSVDSGGNPHLYHWAYGYDTGSNLTTVTYPNGRQVEYVYVDGLVDAVNTRETDADSYVPLATTIDHKPFGPVTSWTFGNGIANSMTYDESYRIDTLVQGTVLNLDYGYDANHNIDTITNSVDSALNQSFTFDAVNRLDTATGDYGAFDYDYDRAGNRTLFSKPSYSETTNLEPGSSRLDDIDIDDNNSLSTRAFTLDAAGNTTMDGAYSYAYNDQNRMSFATGGPHGGMYYLYNGLGQRVVSTNIVTHNRHYHYDLNGDLLMVSSGNNGMPIQQYIRLNGQLVAVVGAKDTDDDGVPDYLDNCIDYPNPDQTDTNTNGIGDACEETGCS